VLIGFIINAGGCLQWQLVRQRGMCCMSHNTGTSVQRRETWFDSPTSIGQRYVVRC